MGQINVNVGLKRHSLTANNMIKQITALRCKIKKYISIREEPACEEDYTVFNALFLNTQLNKKHK